MKLERYYASRDRTAKVHAVEYMALRGFSHRCISSYTDLTVGQVQYVQGCLGLKLTNYRNGQGPVAGSALASVGAILAGKAVEGFLGRVRPGKVLSAQA